MEVLPKLVVYAYYMKKWTLELVKKPFIKVLFYITLVLFGAMLSYIPQTISFGENKSYQRPRRHATDLKYILFWHLPKLHKTHFNYSNRFTIFLPGQTMFLNQNCEYINCYITSDANTLTHLEDYDALIFDINDVRKMDLNHIKLSRSPEQMYIFRSLESASKYPICDRDFDYFFNLTWTYKLNSDIPQPFFNIFDANKTIIGPKLNMQWLEKMEPVIDIESKMQYKNKSVAWVINKCTLKTKHEAFMHEFRIRLKYYNLTLDTLGPCGQYKCRSYLKCQKLVEENYYFQLLSEEYLADDYVTKYVVSAMQQFTLPILVGAGDYQNFLPPGSYINAQSFDLDKLAALINYMIINPDMYKRIFDWKNHYSFEERPTTQVCQLCEQLNKVYVPKKSYSRFRLWWEPEYEDVCERIRLFKIFNSDM